LQVQIQCEGEPSEFDVMTEAAEEGEEAPVRPEANEEVVPPDSHPTTSPVKTPPELAEENVHRKSSNNLFEVQKLHQQVKSFQSPAPAIILPPTKPTKVSPYLDLLFGFVWICCLDLFWS